MTPRVRSGRYELVVEQTGEPTLVLSVDGVVGGGHMFGGGTQGFVTRHADGTWRLLPVEWSRQERAWFCNTNTRTGRGWALVSRTTFLADCGDWPPVRVIGDLPRYANCQSCHASQATVVLDSVRRGYVTRATSLAINCESCHGPGRAHVESATRGTSGASPNAATPALATLNKDASLDVCLQCHAVKDHLRDGFVSGRPLAEFYSLKLPHLGDRPLHPDGRTRTFAYQEGHLYSACYYAGGMTCASCHDPHSQTYRTVTGVPLEGRFDDRQCLACHASKTDRVTEHTRHPLGSPGSACTACHMPLRQLPETRPAAPAGRGTPVVSYARSDHSISIPRPRVDSTLGMGSPCAACHAGLSVDEQERQMQAWWGEQKPLEPAVAAQLAYATQPAPSAALLLPEAGVASPHAMSTYAGLARFMESHVTPGVPIDAALLRRVWRLAGSADVEVRALALAVVHLSSGHEARTRRRLSAALKTEGDRDGAVRARWALALGFKGDSYAALGEYPAAIEAYRCALEIRPGDPRLLLSLANAQRDLGNLPAAVVSYRRSIAEDGRVPLAWVNLGIALSAMADTAAAIEAFSRATALDKSEALARFNLANIMFSRGDRVRAGQMYEETAALDPGNTLAHFQLARLALLRRDERAALNHLRRGLRFDSTNVEAREMAALLATRLGNVTGK